MQLGGKGRKRAEGAGSADVPIQVFDKETGMETISFNECSFQSSRCTLRKY